MLVKLILMMSAFPLTILFVGIAGIIVYKRTIREKSWFDGLQLEFNSVDCPHTKKIPYEKTFGLSFKRKEKRVKTVIFNKSEVRKDVTFLLRCDECGKRRFFHLVQTPEVKAYSKHKTLYLLGTFGAIFLVYGIIVAPVLTLITKLFNL